MQMGFSSALQSGIFKRKFRWTLAIESCLGNIMTEQVCKTGNRPNIDIDEQQIDYLNARMWIPGKATLETLEFVFFDVANSVVSNLLAWLLTVYNFDNPAQLNMASNIKDYAGQGTLNMYDGCGNILESWTLINMWPKTLNFGDLDMSSAEECTISLTVRYQNLDYNSNCGGTPTACPCTPCSGGASGGAGSF